MSNRTAWPGQATTGATHTAAHDNDLPGGWIGYVEITASQTGIAGTMTDITGLSQAVTVNASRRIKVSAYCMGTVMTNSDTRAELYIREGSTILQTARMSTQTANQDDLGAQLIAVILTPTTGAHTYKVSMIRQTGTGTISFRAATDGPSWLLVEDIGPA